jgi:hypothetical protein
MAALLLASEAVQGHVRRGATKGLLAIVAAAVLGVPSSALAQGPFSPPNDLLALGQGGGQTPDTVPTLRRPEPPLVATPRAHCGPGAQPEPGIQGRVPAGAADKGLWCNATLVSHQGTSGGFKVLRYVDTGGHECAFYDTALLFPTNAINQAGPSLGVAVLDMSDPAHPVQTDTLTEPPMLSPHESVSLNPKRGLIAAVLGNPSTYPGLVSIYDAHQDCRHPVLQSTALVARFGHESGFSPDGKTFWATGTALKAITAIDVTDPKAPHPIWHGNVQSHGMSLSDDGNRAYIADSSTGEMLILDTSEIQARKPDPQAREISRLTWNSASIPQNALPFTRDGKPYILEFDEYTAGLRGDNDAVGAARIIDISDEKQPHVVSNLRLQVNQRADHQAANGDPGAQSPVQGYAAHYCNVPTRVNPTIVACSFITSGLRVFDISDLNAPKEIAYYVAPTQAAIENGFKGSSYAMSQPAFAPSRHEVWYSEGATGFYVLHIADNVWPRSPTTTSSSCTRRRSFLARIHAPRGAAVRSVRATLAGKRVAIVRRRHRRYAKVHLAGNRAVLVVRVRLRNGHTLTTRRALRLCAAR